MPLKNARIVRHFSFFVTVGLLLLAFLGLLVSDLIRSRDAEIERQEKEMASLVAVLERHIADTIGKIDLVLWTVGRDFPLLETLPQAQVDARLAALLQQIPDSQSLRIGNPQGNMRFDASGTRPAVNISDRAYFRRLKDDPNPGLVVSEPIFARITHNWVITLSRRLEVPSGEFVGHVQAAVNADRFAEVFSRIVHRGGDVIALYDRDLRLIARSPAAPEQLGKPLQGSRLLSLIEAGQSEGRFVTVSVVDGVERHFLYRALSDLPFVIVVGKSEEEMLANWYRRATFYGASAFLLALVVGLLMWSWQKNYRSAVLSADAMRDKYKHMARHASYIETHDTLTQLPNRQSLAANLAKTLGEAQAPRRSLALLMVDLDHFKNINESLGHAAGDKLLQQFANRLLDIVRDHDSLVRLGGDEFVLVVPGTEAEAAAAHMAQRILDATVAPLVVEGQELHVTCSIGISVYPQDGLGADALLQHADAALYEAKAGGRNAYRFFTREMNERVGERVRLESRLRKALAERKLQLHYQPQYRMHDKRMIGVEALLRWHDADEGFISPARFIPIAEESGLIKPIGAWVLEEACRQAMRWQAAGLPPLVVAVNLSVAQLLAPNFVAGVRSVLDDTGVSPQWLELEITESMLMSDTERTIETLAELRVLGVRIAIDDFGTGYSSFAYLKKLPLDTLKIDKSFIDDVDTDAGSRAIVHAIIAVADSLGLTALAEGVETEAQAGILRGYGCDMAQGYLFSRPIPADGVTRLLGNEAVTAT